MTREELEQFVAQVRALGTVDMPSVAAGMNVNWFRDVKPHLLTTPWFKESLLEAMEEIKFSLLQDLLNTGRNGKRRNGADPEISYINAIIKVIDGGGILGKHTGEEGSSVRQLSKEEEKAHLQRLGYGEEEIARLTKKAE